MRSSYKTNLVNAFPIPKDHPSRRLSLKGVTDPIPPEPSDEYICSGSFAFLSLPLELRRHIYNHLIFTPTCSALASTCHLLHRELTHYLYSTTPIRLFPLQDFTSTPSLLQIRPHDRTHITTLIWHVGSSWTSPPKDWRCGKAMQRCLGRMKNVRLLKLYVEMDPSEPMFAKYRVSKDFYTDFCGELLRAVLKCLPDCRVELDGSESVRYDGDLVMRLRKEAEDSGRRVIWGTESGWKKNDHSALHQTVEAVTL